MSGTRTDPIPDDRLPEVFCRFPKEDSRFTGFVAAFAGELDPDSTKQAKWVGWEPFWEWYEKIEWEFWHAYGFGEHERCSQIARCLELQRIPWLPKLVRPGDGPGRKVNLGTDLVSWWKQRQRSPATVASSIALALASLAGL